jgi:hypothetical protein
MLRSFNSAFPFFCLANSFILRVTSPPYSFAVTSFRKGAIRSRARMVEPTAAWMTTCEMRRSRVSARGKRRGRRGKPHLMLLPRNDLPQPLCPFPPLRLYHTPMHNRTQRIDLLSIHQNIHPTQIALLVRGFFVIERGETGGDGFEGGMEGCDD